MRAARTTAAVLLALSMLVRPATGQESGIKLGIRPETGGGFFEVAMAPGESKQMTAVLTNFGSVQIAARTYPADAYTIVNGGFGARMRGEARTQEGRWLSYPEEVIALAPGQSVNRIFSVNVPGEAAAGEYLAALVIENDLAVQGEGPVAINRIQRQAIAVAVTIPGPQTAVVEFKQASHKVVAGRSVVAVGLMNSGNVHLRLTGAHNLLDSAGKSLRDAPIAMDTFYAGDESALEVPVDSLLEPGTYYVVVTLEDKNRRTNWESARLPFTVAAAPQQSGGEAAGTGAAPMQRLSRLDPKWLVGMGAAGLLIAGLILLVKRRGRGKGGGPQSPTPQIIE